MEATTSDINDTSNDDISDDDGDDNNGIGGLQHLL